jgi:protein ImuB
MSDLVRRWRRLDPRTPIVLSRKSHKGETVAAACPLAMRAGIGIGMTVAHARALLPASAPNSPFTPCLEPIDEERSNRALRRLAVWSMRFIPIVAVDESPIPSGSAGLLLDATGCERLYRGADRMLTRYATAIRRLGLRCRIAAAPTFGAAWALSWCGESDRVCVSHEGLRAALTPLPIEALRLEVTTLERLHAVGVTQIGQLLAIRRTSLVERYGHHTLLRIDQALGNAMESVRPIRVRRAVEAAMPFEGPTDNPETVALAVRTLVREVAEQLAKREAGCRRLEVVLDRADLAPLSLVIRTAKPGRNAKHLWTLLAPKIENAQLGFGVQGVRVAAGGMVPLRHEQAVCVTTSAHESRTTPDDLARLIDAFTARLGVRSVLMLQPVQSHIPERAFRYEPIHDADDLHGESHDEDSITPADRPTLLYEHPRVIDVTLLFPDGPIGMVLYRGRACAAVTSTGPERIEPEWWRVAEPNASTHAHRDYFRVQVQDGRVLWIYRDSRGGARRTYHPNDNPHDGQSDDPSGTTEEADNENRAPGPRWYLHGEWA